MDTPAVPVPLCSLADITRRSTAEVFEEHLALRCIREIELDIERNYDVDVVLLTSFGVWRGHDGVRHGAKVLCEQLPDAQFTYVTRHVDGDIAFLEWKAECERAIVEDGADTFLIRDGRIVVKTIHYTVRPR